VLLGNLPRALVSWLLEMLALAVSPALADPGRAPPRWALEDLDPYTGIHWVAFESVVVVEDR
jgi:hypothetical protein